MRTAYHPQSDGQIEVLNVTLEYLRCFYVKQPKSWVEFIPWAEYWYNTCYQGAARCYPIWNSLWSTTPIFGEVHSGEVLLEAMTQDLMETINQLKFHLNKAHNHMTKYVNNHRLPSKIKEGDWVCLKIRPHRQASMPTRLNPKLSAKYYHSFSSYSSYCALATT